MTHMGNYLLVHCWNMLAHLNRAGGQNRFVHIKNALETNEQNDSSS